MQIEPQPNIVYLKIDEAKAGVLDTSSRPSAVEYAEVVEVGGYKVKVGKNEPMPLESRGIKKGDHVFVKAWAIDIIDFEGKKYHFVNLKSDGILAVVRK